MTMENALEAAGEGFAGSPTGFRRLTPGLLKVDRTAESFAGLPDGVTMHGQLLAAFKAAAPPLGIRAARSAWLVGKPGENAQPCPDRGRADHHKGQSQRETLRKARRQGQH